MTVLDGLATSNAPVVVELIAKHDVPPPTATEGAWDNQPTWDNWAKNAPVVFDNRPTWDNWNKKK